MDNVETSHQLRCFCRMKPLLALYGKDSAGKLYVHVKVYKSKRLYAEMVVQEGKVQIRCRECFRWHRVRIVGNQSAELVPNSDPTIPQID